MPIDYWSESTLCFEAGSPN